MSSEEKELLDLQGNIKFADDDDIDTNENEEFIFDDNTVNFEIIDKGEFIRISRFTNQLYNLVFNKNQMISEFRRQVNGINGKLVDKKIVQQFREKQYMIEIDRNKIFTRSFYEIKNNLKLNV